ncbi:B3 domain-containing protein At3g19184 [Coffea arabica]|uniref:B3 domain-containing protein At3g19184 n=1 Tax=Coffea arabica TaxID=13443 RepID=A0A6P6U2U0_COFAR|nr:B3 domain-containing protein At3g19184-like [Coffea arabica]
MVVSKKGALAYEERRHERLEQNKKKLEQLNLTKLSQALHSTISPKPSPMKKVKPKVARQPVDPSTIRRSSRVADKPPPNYKEVPIEPLGRPRSYRYSRRDLSNRVYASDEDREYAHERAEVLQSGLDSKIPSFVKPMLQSHVTGGFWLGLPVQFCKTYLPKRDETVTLVDEQEEEYPTKYLAVKTGLSGGWRGFSIEHELVDGDALVFQLIEPTKFKVYIIRVNQAEDSSN